MPNGLRYPRWGARRDAVPAVESLKTLLQHDVVLVDADGHYDFAVPLMRRWVRGMMKG